MSGDFIERIQILRDNVGAGKTTGHVEVNQVYAAYQEFHPEFKHPDGGKAFYLRDSLYEGEGSFMRKLAERCLQDEGHGFSAGMMEAMEDLSLAVFHNAPWEFSDLRASGHPFVEHNGAVIHDRPPHVARLSEGELKEKRRLSQLFDPGRYS